MTLLPSDATLLQAILFGCGSSSITLNSIMNTAISLGHDLPTFAQFDGGLARLVEAELITYEDKRVRPTAEALQIADEIMCQHGSPDLFHDRLLQLFSTWTLDNSPGRVQREYSLGSLTAAEFDSAFA